MGKNPNAKKLKEKKHKERAFESNIEDLEEEAARKGITVLELQELKEEEKERVEEEDSDEGSDEDSAASEIKRKREILRKQKELEKKQKK